MHATDTNLNSVVLVNEFDQPIGTAERLQAHQSPGVLHRAVSVCLVSDTGEVLLQRRALSKYHFSGLWSNSCCTHPRPSETPLESAVRRTREELGLDVRDLDHRGFFIYKAFDERSGLTEFELDHVFVGRLQGRPAPDPSEVMDWRLVESSRCAMPEFSTDEYTPWMVRVLELALDA